MRKKEKENFKDKPLAVTAFIKYRKFIQTELNPELTIEYNPFISDEEVVVIEVKYEGETLLTDFIPLDPDLLDHFLATRFHKIKAKKLEIILNKYVNCFNYGRPWRSVTELLNTPSILSEILHTKKPPTKQYIKEKHVTHEMINDLEKMLNESNYSISVGDHCQDAFKYIFQLRGNRKKKIDEIVAEIKKILDGDLWDK